MLHALTYDWRFQTFYPRGMTDLPQNQDFFHTPIATYIQSFSLIAVVYFQLILTTISGVHVTWHESCPNWHYEAIWTDSDEWFFPHSIRAFDIYATCPRSLGYDFYEFEAFSPRGWPIYPKINRLFFLIPLETYLYMHRFSFLAIAVLELWERTDQQPEI